MQLPYFTQQWSYEKAYQRPPDVLVRWRGFTQKIWNISINPVFGFHDHLCWISANLDKIMMEMTMVMMQMMLRFHQHLYWISTKFYKNMRIKKNRFMSADAPDVYCFSNPGSQQSSLQLVRFPNHVSCDKNCYCVAVAPSCSRPQGLRGRGGVLSVAVQLTWAPCASPPGRSSS